MSETLGTDPGSGRSGFGTKIQGSISGPIGMIQNVNIDGVEIGDLDVTTMNSPGRFMQFVSSLKDPKQIVLQLLYESVNFAIILAGQGITQTFTVTFPDGSTYVQAGYIKTYGIQSNYNDKMLQPVTLKMSGPPTFTAGSA